jgi:hypothetical protein
VPPEEAGREPDIIPIVSPVPIVSITMRCIVNLSCQFFLVMLIKFVLKTALSISISEKINPVVETVSCVPMLCILFMATWLRAVQLSKGKPEAYDLPPWWAEAAMIICTWSVFFWTLMVAICTLMKMDGAKGKIFTLLRASCAICVYVSLAVVCVGMCVMKPPPKLWSPGGIPWPSPAVLCTMCLTILYFVVLLAVELTEEVNGLMGQARRFSRGKDILRNAHDTVAFAPMMCALFIAVRMRALQFDPVNGNPQRWVQLFFCICTFGVFFQTVLAVVSSAVGVQERQDHRGVGLNFRRKVDMMTSITNLTSLVLKAWNYISVLVIVVGMYVMRPRGGDELSLQRLRSVPVALHCVTSLVVLFFLVHLVGWVVQLTQKSNSSTAQGSGFVYNFGEVIEKWAKDCIAFCPIFCVVYLGLFLRAMRLTNGHGNPQGWCHDVMYVSVGVLQILTLAPFLMLLTGVGRSPTVVSTVIQYVCLLLLLLCMVGLILGLSMMNYENATGQGGFFSL